MGKHVNQGFTLIELLISMAIFAVVLASGAPGFDNLIRDNRLGAAANELSFSLTRARSEAIKRGATVRVTAADAGWQAGWAIWVDSDDDNSRSSDETLALVQRTGDGVEVMAAGSLAEIWFVGTGRANTGEEFQFCDQRNDEIGRVIRVGKTGHTSYRKDDLCNAG